MEKLISFLKTMPNNKYILRVLGEDEISFTYLNDCDGNVLVIIPRESEIFNNMNDMDDWLSSEHDIEIRFCDRCGKPFDVGYTSEETSMYCCEECFDDYMDETYGKDKWKEVDDDFCNGYYMYLDDTNNWDGTGIYWTEW